MFALPVLIMMTLTIGVSSAAPSESLLVCEDSLSTLYHGKCFRHFDNRLRWREAQAACITWGGSLASVKSQDEATLISDISNSLSSSDFAWIGLNYRGRKHQDWVWSDGTLLASEKYTNWLQGQPDAAHYGISSSPFLGVPPMNGRRPDVV